MNQIPIERFKMAIDQIYNVITDEDAKKIDCWYEICTIFDETLPEYGLSTQNLGDSDEEE